MSAPAGRLRATRDPRTGEVFVPARNVSVDGSLRKLEATTIAAEGVLTTVIEMGEHHYAYLDLEGDVRLIGEVDDPAPEVGARYLVVETQNGRRFRHA